MLGYRYSFFRAGFTLGIVTNDNRQPAKKGVQYCHKFAIFAMHKAYGTLRKKPHFRPDLQGLAPVARFLRQPGKVVCCCF
jgi:hypothetical protein